MPTIAERSPASPPIVVRRSDPLARVPSPALVLGAIASVQMGAALATTIFDRTGPGGAVLLRLVSASAVLLLVWRPRIGAIVRRQLALVAPLGLALAAMNLCFYQALARIPLGIAVALEFAGPLAVGVAASHRRLDLVWVALAVGGIVALTRGEAHSLNGLGVALALASGGAWGAYILIQSRIGRTFRDGSGLAVAMCLATGLALPVGVAEGGGGLLRPHDLLIGVAVGLLSSALPYSLELEALRRIAAGAFGVLMSLEPAVAALAGFLLLGQGLSVRELAGIALVVAASLGAVRSSAGGPTGSTGTA
jgi:inner membrane transporter RhtA